MTGGRPGPDPKFETRAEYSAWYYASFAQRARGCRPRQPNGPLAEKITAAMALGLSRRQVALGAGVGDATVRRILLNPTWTSSARVADKIREFRPARPVTPVGLTRRMHALAALGWSTAAIAEVAGVNRDTVKSWRRGEVTEIHVVAGPLLRAYDALSMRQPPQGTKFERGAATQVRARAVRNGWVPPLAWDDESIDDPNAKPHAWGRRHHGGADLVIDEVAIERVLAGDRADLTKAERLIVVEQFAAAGLSDAQIAERVGVTDRTVYRDRDENGIASRWVA